MQLVKLNTACKYKVLNDSNFVSNKKTMDSPHSYG